MNKVLTWEDFRSFVTTLGESVHIAFVETSDLILPWVQYRGMVIESAFRKTDTSALAQFNAEFRPRGNRAEADRVRITTCRFGRKLSARFISFATAAPSSMDNTDENAVDYGDATYVMKDAANVTTANPALAVRTLIDFQPAYDYEISAGAVFIPPVLAGVDEDFWELHVRAAPDIPAQFGGSIPFVANNRIKWIKGGRLELDASLNPAEVSGAATALARKIRFTFLHPAGASSEFQISMRIFR